MALVLASQSPRRREILALAVPNFVVEESLVDESRFLAQNPAQLALALAGAKAADVFGRRRDDVVIGCDTVVEIQGQCLGKPVGEANAAHMMALLSGQKHSVHTGVAVYYPGCGTGFEKTGEWELPPVWQPEDDEHVPQGDSAGRPIRFIETTAVYFDDVPPPFIAAYVKTKEPYDKAGGYAIQGWAARYIRRIEGCYYNVMGLPLARLCRQLEALHVLA